jgi:hypothetical protein
MQLMGLHDAGAGRDDTQKIHTTNGIGSSLSIAFSSSFNVNSESTA